MILVYLNVNYYLNIMKKNIIFIIENVVISFRPMIKYMSIQNGYRYLVKNLND